MLPRDERDETAEEGRRPTVPVPVPARPIVMGVVLRRRKDEEEDDEESLRAAGRREEAEAELCGDGGGGCDRRDEKFRADSSSVFSPGPAQPCRVSLIDMRAAVVRTRMVEDSEDPDDDAGR